MVIRSYEIDTISCINDLKLFSNDKLFVFVVCSDDIPNFVCSMMDIHEINVEFLLNQS